MFSNFSFSSSTMLNFIIGLSILSIYSSKLSVSIISGLYSGISPYFCVSIIIFPDTVIVVYRLFFLIIFSISNTFCFSRFFIKKSSSFSIFLVIAPFEPIKYGIASHWILYFSILPYGLPDVNTVIIPFSLSFFIVFIVLCVTCFSSFTNVPSMSINIILYFCFSIFLPPIFVILYLFLFFYTE